VAGTPGLRIDHYDWAGGREAVLRFGPDEAAPIVVAALPPFEEGNRTRAAMVDVLRRLAARGVASALPDLPGAGESLVPTVEATPAMWRQAFAAACASLPAPVHVMAWRGGALIDGEAAVASRWYLSPQSGAALVRELARIRGLAGREDYAGNILSGAMIEALAVAQPATAEPLRVVRLDGDVKAADRKLPGAPLWRAAEPGTDTALQEMIASDVADWVLACG
jgi:hypothetical protein